jgi:hypothetical protein
LYFGHYSGGKTSAAHYLIQYIAPKFHGHYISFKSDTLTEAMKIGIPALVNAMAKELMIDPPCDGTFISFSQQLRFLHPNNNVLICDEIDHLQKESVHGIWSTFKSFIKTIRDKPFPRIVHSIVCIGSAMLTEDVQSQFHQVDLIPSESKDDVMTDVISTKTIEPLSPTALSFAASSAPIVDSPWNAETGIEASHFSRQQHNQFYDYCRCTNSTNCYR